MVVIIIVYEEGLVMGMGNCEVCGRKKEINPKGPGSLKNAMEFVEPYSYDPTPLMFIALRSAINKIRIKDGVEIVPRNDILENTLAQSFSIEDEVFENGNLRKWTFCFSPTEMFKITYFDKPDIWEMFCKIFFTYSGYDLNDYIDFFKDRIKQKFNEEMTALVKEQTKAFNEKYQIER